MNKNKKKSLLIVSILIILVIVIVLLIKIKKNNEINRLPREIVFEKPVDLIEIEPNEYNEYESMQVTDERKAIYVFDDFKSRMLYETQSVFDSLDEEYKELRFNNDVDSFNKYFEYIKEELKKSYISSYGINKDENYTQYIIEDQYNNYYIFNEKGVLNYSILLDYYTIQVPQFNEKYDETNEKGKCILNIEKVKQALNSGDYKYIYGKLNEQFKSKNYSTLSAFENYMKSNLNKYNKIEYKEFKNEGETYIYNVELTDLLGKTDKTINMQILMQLKDDRDFVMSFSIK